MFFLKQRNFNMSLSKKFKAAVATVSLAILAVTGCTSPYQTSDGKIVQGQETGDDRTFFRGNTEEITVHHKIGLIHVSFHSLTQQDVTIHYPERQFCMEMPYSRYALLCKDFDQVKDPGNKQLIEKLHSYLDAKPVSKLAR